MLEDAKYGELIIEHFWWGYDGDTIGSESRPINFHYCSDEELGIEPGSKTVIYPIFESSRLEMLTFRKKFKCVDREELVIWGDFNSKKAQQLAIKFKMYF